MCEHCDAVDGVLAGLLGRKPTDIIMKRVMAKVHGSQMENVLDCTVKA
jgi:hypothetical protein